ncbi:TPA: hypothetical protein KOX39_003408 [Clostridioides difficile]|nr:hypothetical protein [Clostridioides difficile]
MIKVNIEGLDIPQKLELKAKKVTKEAITEYTMDLLRVATLRTPVDEGNLEKSGTKEIKNTPNGATGKVSFKAMNKGYNYAVKMHNGRYKLGKESKAKSSRGARSKYYNGTFKVGSKYLEGTALSCKKGYEKDIQLRLSKALDR